ncbi:MAG: tRNA pseudouridine(38-40) synthase TruA [Rhodobacter sp.]|nr:tRNA pseudouridine(38-40) synthase TruA [Rhodobacter sp.]
MPRYALKIEYHGGPFHGWQRQALHPSVQGAVETALAALEPDVPGIAAAGRTDAGVHALGQVAHCDLAKDWDAFRLSEALNHHLKPLPVAVVAAARVDADFHARFSAVERRYRYRVICRRAPLTHLRGLAWKVPQMLDLAAMQKAAEYLVGRHDFTTFRASECQANSPVKTVDEFRVTATGPEVEFHVRARSFLHSQVRSFVGTLERVGAGAWTAEDVHEALQTRARAACGPVAPPDGLYLESVGYAADPFADRCFARETFSGKSLR